MELIVWETATYRAAVVETDLPLMGDPEGSVDRVRERAAAGEALAQDLGAEGAVVPVGGGGGNHEDQ